VESAAALAGLVVILVSRPWRCEDRDLRDYSALAVAVLGGLLLMTLSLRTS
jgi:hypothetical protein